MRSFLLCRVGLESTARVICKRGSVTSPVLFDQHENMVDTDRNLFDEFNFENKVFSNVYRIVLAAFPHTAIDIEVVRLVVLHVAWSKSVVSFKFIKG